MKTVGQATLAKVGVQEGQQRFVAYSGHETQRTLNNDLLLQTWISHTSVSSRIEIDSIVRTDSDFLSCAIFSLE